MGSGTDLAKLPRVRGRTRCYPWPMEAMEGGFSDALAIWNAVGTGLRGGGGLQRYSTPSELSEEHVVGTVKHLLFRKDRMPVSAGNVTPSSTNLYWRG